MKEKHFIVVVLKKIIMGCKHYGEILFLKKFTTELPILLNDGRLEDKRDAALRPLHAGNLRRGGNKHLRDELLAVLVDVHGNARCVGVALRLCVRLQSPLELAHRHGEAQVVGEDEALLVLRPGRALQHQALHSGVERATLVQLVSVDVQIQLQVFQTPLVEL